VVGDALEHFDSRSGAGFALLEHGVLRELERVE
jgi:hypothetical protein